MASWDELEAELAIWADAGERPTFWWRDDDTQAPTRALDRLIGLAERFDVPLHLAIVPAEIDPRLAGRLRASPLVRSMQHGFAHKNHEPKGARASEVGEHRDLEETRADLREGWRRLQAAELPNLLPVFVPPWNRIGAKVLPVLVDLGFRGVSDFYRRPDPEPVRGLRHINAHIDPIRWKGGARFAGTEKVLEQCVTHLRQRRTGDAARDEPTGFCTHHLQTDADTWGFCEAFLDRLTAERCGQWLGLEDQLEPSCHA